MISNAKLFSVGDFDFRLQHLLIIGILAIAVSEFGSIVTSNLDDAKTGEIPLIAIKTDKNAIITIDFFNTQFYLLYL